MNGQDRPAFSLRMPVDEFSRHYWYKAELAAICRKCGLSAYGTKAELESRIKDLLAGNLPEQANGKTQSSLRKKSPPGKITLETRLIPDGFRFNQQAREFFANYYGVKRFSFTKEMAAALRDAERRGDHDMTVADLIRVYESHRDRPRAAQDTPEEKTYLWNQFVREFNRDPRTRGLKNRMKVAAFLWHHVRTLPGPKVYTSALLERFHAEISEFSDH